MRHRYVIWFFLLGLLTWAPPLPAQYNLTRTYTVQDGLPMTEVGRCFVSRRGYVYFTSTTGLQMMFDGFSFKGFNPSGKLGKMGPIEFIGEDQYGVWFVMGGQVFWYPDNVEVQIDAPPIINAFLDEENDRLVLEDAQHNLLLFNPQKKQFEADSALTARRARYAPDSYYFIISKFGKHWEVVMNEEWTGRFIYAHDQELKGEGHLVYPVPVNAFYPLSAESYLLLLPRQESLPSENLEVFFFNGRQLAPLRGTDPMGRERHFTGFRIYALHNRILMYGPPPPELASGPEDWEVWEVDTSGRPHFIARFQVPASISSFYPQLDPAGNLWVPSQGGLVKVFPAFLGCLEGQPYMGGGLHVINEDLQGRIWFGFYSQGFALFDGSRILPPLQGATPDQRIMPGTWRDGEGNMYFFKQNYKGFFRTDGRHWEGHSGHVPREEKETGYVMQPLANGQLALGLNNHKGIGLLDPPYEPDAPLTLIDSVKGMKLRNVLTIAEDRAQRLWFGRHSQGIGVYDPKQDTAVTWLIEDPGDIGAISSFIDSRGNLWLGTGQGLAFLESPQTFDFFEKEINDHLRIMTFPEVGNSLVVFVKEHRGYLFFGNLQGFGLLDLESFYRDPEHPRVHFFNTIDYLPVGSSEQNAVLIDRKDRIWMGNDAGAIRLDPDLLVLDTSTIRLDSLIFFHGSGEEFAPYRSSLRPPRGQRNISFYWHSTFDGQLTPNRWLSYQLILAGGDTLKADPYLLEQNVDLGYIPPGDHRLELTLFKDNQIHDRASLQLIIPKNLEDTWWFWALISGFLLLAGSLLLWQVYQKRRQQQRFELETERLIREKEALQIEAITSSLNPHFLNNTLHWVQAKVWKDEVASLFIDKLAENMRIIFQKSRNRQAFHGLIEELDLVKNYLNIQTNRFGDRYRFLLPDEGTLLQYRHLQVPLMQILIHAENAIERGLRNRIGSTYLRIGLSDDAHYLYITVEDDGVGYSNAREMGIGGTQQGNKMLDSLHEIFNARNERKITTRIEDNLFTDPQTGKSYGTRIIIQIPKKYDYEFETHQSPGRGRRTPGP